MISRLALVAAAGMLLGVAPAYAGDLGGGSLEDRIAELEATTARKGNSKVSLQLYGQVNKALLIWDDGKSSDAHIVDNTRASSRFGFLGKANFGPGWSAGYNMELELLDLRADEVSNGVYDLGNGKEKNGADGLSSGLGIRQNYWYIENEKLGRISVGKQHMASSGTSEVVLGNSMRSADVDTGSAMCPETTTANPKCSAGFLNSTVMQRKGLPISDFELYAMQWSEDFTANNIAEAIRYDSPSFYGFVLSASWDARDYADVALRFQKELNNFRIAGAVSYQWDNRYPAVDDGLDIIPSANFTALAGSVSVMHMPTGLYGAFASGKRDFRDNSYLEDPSYWYVQGGIERKFLPYGTTTIYGEYGVYKNYMASYVVGEDDDGNLIAAKNDSKATRIGFGAVQKIDAANMDIYAQATIWSFENNASKAGYGELEPYKLYDLSTVMVGSRIKF